MAGYTRQSAADIIPGAEVTAAPLNAEFNQIQSAMHGSTGHNHQGGSGNGPQLSLTAAVTGVLPAANGGVGAALTTTVDNTVPRFNGTAGIMQTSGVSISDLDVITAAGLTSSGAVSGTTGTFTGSLTASGGGSLTGTWTSLGTVTTVDINGGTVDGAIIGGTSAAAGTFTTLIATTGTGIATLNATNLTTGTVPDARFPATLPAANGSALTALNATQLTTGTVPIARVAGSYTSITGVGALTAGSLSSTFGNITIGSSTITTTGAVATGNLTVTGTIESSAGITTANHTMTNTLIGRDVNTSSLTVAGGASGLGGRILMFGPSHATLPNDIYLDGERTFLRGPGGSGLNTLTVAGAIISTGSGFSGSGGAITGLNATNLSTGTIPVARVSGSYTSITGVGALAAGSISSTFGAINIGSSTLSAGIGTFTGQVKSSQNFVGSDTNAVLAVNSSGNVILRPNGAASGTGQFVIASTGNGTVNGDLTVTGTITASSDIRLKSDIKTLDNSLTKVNSLRGVSFTKDGKKSIGLIAQEVREVLPELVLEDESGYLSVAYGNIVAVLIEAVKELTEKVKVLEAK